jgi:hypothetical protein
MKQIKLSDEVVTINGKFIIIHPSELFPTDIWNDMEMQIEEYMESGVSPFDITVEFDGIKFFLSHKGENDHVKPSCEVRDLVTGKNLAYIMDGMSDYSDDYYIIAPYSLVEILRSCYEDTRKDEEIVEDYGGVFLTIDSPAEVLSEDDGNSVLGTFFIRTTEEDLDEDDGYDSYDYEGAPYSDEPDDYTRED